MKRSVLFLWALLLLAAACSSVASAHNHPAHSAAWNKGHSFALANSANFGLTGWTAVHWCSQMSTEASNYYQAPEQNAWAAGCTAGLSS